MDVFDIRSRPRLAAASALLRASGLPADDLRDEQLEHFFFVGGDRSPAGLIGLELYGSEALLRSLVVEADKRRQGLARTLVNHAERYAAAQRVRSLYLLTTAAEDFFAKLGYTRIDRTGAPPAIRTTTEFASLCPASSAFMVKPLNPVGVL